VRGGRRGAGRSARVGLGCGLGLQAGPGRAWLSRPRRAARRVKGWHKAWGGLGGGCPCHAAAPAPMPKSPRKRARGAVLRRDPVPFFCPLQASHPGPGSASGKRARAAALDPHNSTNIFPDLSFVKSTTCASIKASGKATRWQLRVQYHSNCVCTKGKNTRDGVKTTQARDVEQAVKDLRAKVSHIPSADCLHPLGQRSTHARTHHADGGRAGARARTHGHTRTRVHACTHAPTHPRMHARTRARTRPTLKVSTPPSARTMPPSTLPNTWVVARC